MSHLVGRDDEQRLLLDQIERAAQGPRAVLLEGEAGIGKTALWKMALTTAEDRGHRVLTARVAEFETGLSYVGLADLLEGITETDVENLPAVQRSALNAALLRSEEEGPDTDWRAVSAGLLGLLRAYSKAGPVVVGIDDIQWLDHATANVLATTLRRLQSEPVFVVMTRRTPSAPDPFDPADLLRDTLEVIEVMPLDEVQLEQLIRSRLDRRLLPPVIKKIHQASGGNPFYALEIARSLGDVDISRGRSLPLPKNLTRVISDRLAGLSDAALQVLLVMASVSRPTVSLLDRALGDKKVMTTGMDEARRADVLELDGDLLRFTHPLFASTIYEETDADARRSLHQRLSELTDDVEQSAAHLARAIPAPSEEVARSLDQAAVTAKARGAIQRAGELAWMAVDFTEPETTGQFERIARAAELDFLVGDRERLAEVVRATLSKVKEGPTRARLLLIYSELAGNLDEGIEGLTEALTQTNEDPTLHTKILLQRGQMSLLRGDLVAAEKDARSAMAVAEGISDRYLIVRAISNLGAMHVITGHPDAERVVAQACAMPEASDIEPIYDSPLNLQGKLAEANDDLDSARLIYENLLKIAEEKGDTGYSYGGFLLHLLEVECRAGRLARADALAEEMVVLDGEGTENQSGSLTCYGRGLAHVLLGRVEQARAHAERGARIAEKLGDAVFLIQNRWVLGLAALTEGEYEEACDQMGDLPRIASEMGARDPNRFIFDGDLIEALIGAGRIEEARTRLDDLQDRAEEHSRIRALAISARCRGMLANHRGEHDEALAAVTEALELHAKITDQPFELARTLLAKGMVERRAKQRGAARESLDRARSIFIDLGNAVWTARAGAEAKRIGGRAPAPDALTPTEEQVARLVAEGSSNKEVAEQLFMSVKTVESNLSRIYRKLDVRSRTQLGQKLRDESEATTQT